MNNSSKSKIKNSEQIPFGAIKFHPIGYEAVDNIVKNTNIQIPSETITSKIVSNFDVEDVEGFSNEECRIKLKDYLSYGLNVALENFSCGMHNARSQTIEMELDALSSIQRNLTRVIKVFEESKTDGDKLGGVFKSQYFQKALRQVSHGGRSDYFDSWKIEQKHQDSIEELNSVVRTAIKFGNEILPPSEKSNPTQKFIAELAQIYSTAFGVIPGYSKSAGQDGAMKPFPRFLTAVFSQAYGFNKKFWPIANVDGQPTKGIIDGIDREFTPYIHFPTHESWLKEAKEMGGFT